MTSAVDKWPPQTEPGLQARLAPLWTEAPRLTHEPGRFLPGVVRFSRQGHSDEGMGAMYAYQGLPPAELVVLVPWVAIGLVAWLIWRHKR